MTTEKKEPEILDSIVRKEIREWSSLAKPGARKVGLAYDNADSKNRENGYNRKLARFIAIMAERGDINLTIRNRGDRLEYVMEKI